MAVSSNSKEVIEKNKKYLLSYFEGRNKKEQFVSQIDYMRHPRATIYATVRDWIDSGSYEYTYYGRAKYLNKIGLKKYNAEDIDKLTDKQCEEINNLFVHILARDGEKLYNEVKKAKGELQKKSKTTTTKPKTKPKTKTIRRRR
jgi:hypothetical protein